MKRAHIALSGPLTAGRRARLNSQGRFFLKGTKGGEDTRSPAMETTGTDAPVTWSQFSQEGGIGEPGGLSAEETKQIAGDEPEVRKT